MERIATIIDGLATFGALAVLPVIFVEASSNDPVALRIASAANWVIWCLFLADAATNLMLRGRRFIRSWWGALDILIVVLSFPLLPALMEATRIARLARLARATRFVRYVRLLRFATISARLLHGLRRVTRPDALPYVTAVVVIVVVMGGSALYMVEFAPDRSLGPGDALWWAIVTVTTVGYGDIAPHSWIGRLVASGVMIVGIAFTSLLTAQIAAYLTRTGSEADDGSEHREVEDELRELRAEIQQLRRAVDALRREQR